MKIFIDTIGIPTRDLPAFSAVPQLTAPPPAPISLGWTTLFKISCHW